MACALLVLEIGVVRPAGPVAFTLEVAQDSLQRKVMDFDATGDAHHDLASAFIKSMRGSDPDAALYWLAACWSRAKTRASSSAAS